MHHVIGQFNLMGMSGAPCKRHLRIEIKILAKKKININRTFTKTDSRNNENKLKIQDMRVWGNLM